MKDEKLQVENGGYTRIVNKVIEKLTRYPFPQNSSVPLKLCLVVIRKTWGYQKKSDVISISQFQKETNASRPTVVHWLNYLVKAGLLVKGGKPAKNGNIYSFNKYYEQWNWVVKGGKLVKVRQFTSKTPLTKTSKTPLTHKRKKKYITKEILRTENKFSDDVRKEIINSFKDVNPSYRILFNRKNQAEAIRRLVEVHGKDTLLKIIAILPKTNVMPYAPTITTPIQLEEKIASLRNFFLKEKSKLPTVAKINGADYQASERVKHGDYKCPNCHRWIPKGKQCGYCY